VVLIPDEGSVRKLAPTSANPAFSYLQYGELVAQDQDLCDPPRFLAPGEPQPCDDPRDQEEDEP
jgi:hypothetical protein